jgi:hypothetical protein
MDALARMLSLDGAAHHPKLSNPTADRRKRQRKGVRLAESSG